MEKKTRLINTEEEIKIFSDPYRIKIINIYKNNEEPMTVKNIADIMGDVPAKVHYHVKKLLSINVLKLDHVEVINGINAKYYKLVDADYKIDLSVISDYVEYENKVNKVQPIIINILEHFKKNVLAAKREKTSDNESEIINTTIYSPEIHLSKKEYGEYVKDLEELIEKYSKKGKGKTTYLSIFGITKKLDE